MKVLVSGLTGQLGRGLVEAEHPDLELVPVGRGAGRLGFSERVERAFPRRPELAEAAVEGDVTNRLWGISEPVLDRLAGEVDAVLNLAAITNWAAPRRRLSATNVVGAHNGVKVAEQLRAAGDRCRVYCHASSVHVAGGLVGSVPEARFGPDGTRSAYEQSKWLAEEILAESAERSELTVGIARIGGLIGSTATGETVQQNSLYKLAVMWQRLPGRILPIAGNGRVDVLPRDVAGDVLSRSLFGLADARSPGPHYFHVCAGSAAPTFGSLLATLRSLDATDRFRGYRTVASPYPLLRWLTQNLDRLWPFPIAWRNGIIGHRYMFTPRVFERDRAEMLAGGELPAPSTELLVRLAFNLDRRDPQPLGEEHSLARFQG